MGLIASMSSTSHRNSWYSVSKGQMDDGWPGTLVHTMINHFNTAITALGPLWFKEWRSQNAARWEVVFRCPTFSDFSQPWSVPLPIFWLVYLFTIWIKQLWDKSGIFFQAKVHCGPESNVAMEMWFNNRFGLPLAQIIRQSFCWGQVRSWEHH